MNVKIFGERHTGTNAMRQLVETNFGINVPNHGEWGWKHRMAPQQRELDSRGADDTLFIIMVRDPYTWMQAMARDPYNYHDPECLKGPYKDAIKKPFEDYENLPTAWSEKNASYYMLSRRVEKSMIFRMEDLALDPYSVIESLKEYLKPVRGVGVVPKYCNGRSPEHCKGKKVKDIDRHGGVHRDVYYFANKYLDKFLMEVFDYPSGSVRVSV